MHGLTRAERLNHCGFDRLRVRQTECRQASQREHMLNQIEVKLFPISTIEAKLLAILSFFTTKLKLFLLSTIKATLSMLSMGAWGDV